MKKSILNIGKELNRNEQRSIQGGVSHCLMGGIPNPSAECNEAGECLDRFGHGRFPWECINGCCAWS